MSVADLPVPPPVAPMLATLSRALPPGHWYEPKWDGFRCIAFRDGADVLLMSRHQRPVNRYFPEVEEALRRLPSDRFVVDGEIIAFGATGADFSALMLRLHPAASRVGQLRAETPASYIAFDALAVGREDVRRAALSERRALLAGVLAKSSVLGLTPTADDPAMARAWLERPPASGVDGVVAKDPSSPYEPGRRTHSWLKVKRERTADCVVGGYRVVEDARLVASLLLGVFDRRGSLHHVGVASSFPTRRRRELFEELQPHVMASLAGHPWEHGFALERGPMGRLRGAAGAWDPRTMSIDWVPLRPELVCEVAYDQIDSSGRWRHPARLLRFRPDRLPESCTVEQLAASAAPATIAVEP